jgi:hypothetical protein
MFKALKELINGTDCWNCKIKQKCKFYINNKEMIVTQCGEKDRL